MRWRLSFRTVHHAQISDSEGVGRRRWFSASKENEDAIDVGLVVDVRRSSVGRQEDDFASGHQSLLALVQDAVEENGLP